MGRELKMKRVLLGVGCAVALLPGIASAVTLRVPNIELRPGMTNVPVEAVFDDAAAGNERLFAYTIGLRLVPVVPAVPGAVTFSAPWVTATETAPPVFPGATPPTVQSSDPAHVSASKDIPGEADIGNGQGLVRVYLNAGALAVPGTTYTLSFDPAEASFASTDPNNIEIPVTLSNGTITVVPIPEPAALSLLGVAGLLALRRRRTA